MKNWSFRAQSDHGHGTGAVPLDIIAESFADEANRHHRPPAIRNERLDVHSVFDVVDVVGSAAYPNPHHRAALGELDAVVAADPLDREPQCFSEGPDGDHRSAVYNIGLLVREGNTRAVDGDLQGTVAVVVQEHPFTSGNHGVLVLIGIGPERSGLGDLRQAAVGLLGEDRAQGSRGVDEELPTVDVDASVAHTEAVDEDLSLSFVIRIGRIGRKTRVRGIGRARRAACVDIQIVVALGPAVAEVVGPVRHDEAVAGNHVDLASPGEDLEHVTLGLHADVAGAVDIGTDAVDPDIVHIDGSVARIQVDVGGRGGGGQQTKHHDHSHDKGHKPCFFHCTFLLNIECCKERGCAVLRVRVLGDGTYYI